MTTHHETILWDFNEDEVQIPVEVEYAIVDHGIGFHEYWGGFYYDTQMAIEIVDMFRHDDKPIEPFEFRKITDWLHENRLTT